MNGSRAQALAAQGLHGLGRARLALAVTFFVNGALFGNWALRIPAIKDDVHAGTGALGVALLGIAVGATLSKQVAGQLVARFGSASITRLGIGASCATLPLPALATDLASLTAALFCFGAAMGIVDVAMNAHAISVQDRIGRPIMSSFHGLYSLGGLAGALVGGRAAAVDLSPLAHFAGVGAVLGVAALTMSLWLLPSATDAVPSTKSKRAWAKLPRDRRLPVFLLGCACLCTMAGEGACGDWSAIYLHESLGASAGFAAWGYAAYSIAMAAGRLLGDRFTTRWGGLELVTRSVLFGGVGFAVALAIGDPIAAICGFAVLGLGFSVVVPVLFSAAGRMGGATAGPSITLVSTIGGVGLLAGPPIIGFVAEAMGLPAALGVISLLALVAVGLLRFVGAQDERRMAPARLAEVPSV